MTNILCCAGELAEVRQLGGGCERGGARVQLRLQATRVQSDEVHDGNDNTCLVLSNHNSTFIIKNCLTTQLTTHNDNKQSRD